MPTLLCMAPVAAAAVAAAAAELRSDLVRHLGDSPPPAFSRNPCLWAQCAAGEMLSDAALMHGYEYLHRVQDVSECCVPAPAPRACEHVSCGVRIRPCGELATAELTAFSSTSLSVPRAPQASRLCSPVTAGAIRGIDQGQAMCVCDVEPLPAPLSLCSGYRCSVAECCAPLLSPDATKTPRLGGGSRELEGPRHHRRWQSNLTPDETPILALLYWCGMGAVRFAQTSLPDSHAWWMPPSFTSMLTDPLILSLH